MNNNYTFKWALDEKGFKEISFEEYSKVNLEKSDYVEKYLSPSIQHAKCGWDHCVYYVLENEYGREEYVALYPDESNQSGRYYNVTGNSLGAIAEQIWYGVFR